MLFGTLLQSDVCLLNVKKEKHHVFRQELMGPISLRRITV